MTSSHSISSKGVAGLSGSKELSIIGKEILSSNSHNNQFHLNSSGVPSSQLGSMQMLDKIITEAREESSYPRGPNGLFFGFLDESLIAALNENN